MADAREYKRVISASSAERSARDLHVYTRDIARANGAQIAATMRETSRHRHRGVSNPPGRPRDRTSLKIGGLLTPPLHQ